MAPTSGHVPVLRHGHVRVAQVVGADPRGQATAVDEGGDGLAEAVRGHAGAPDPVPHLAPLLVEVVRVAPGARRRGEDHQLLAEERQTPPCREGVDGKRGRGGGPSLDERGSQRDDGSTAGRTAEGVALLKDYGRGQVPATTSRLGQTHDRGPAT